MSPKFEKVRHYFETGLWTEKMVRDAVDRWITLEEAEEILTGGDEN